MILRFLALTAWVVVLMWFAPWWTLAILGLLLGLGGSSYRPWLRGLIHGLLTFVALFVLTWISDAHSGQTAGDFLATQMAQPRWVLYALSALILSTLVSLGYWTGVALKRLASPV